MKLIFFLSSNLHFCCCSLALVSKLFLPSAASESNCSWRELLSLCTNSPAPLSPQV